MDEGPRATDWPPLEASCPGIVHQVFSATLSGHRGSPASSRNLCPPVLPGTAPRRAGRRQYPSQPELHHVPHLFSNGRIVVVEIRLVTEEAMPIVGFRNRVPRPVGLFRVEKNDAGPLVPGVGIAPDVPVAARVVARTSRLLKPRMLIGCVVQHHFDDDPDSSIVGP